MAFIGGSVTAADSASAQASAEELYVGAVTRLASIAQQPYLEYTMADLQTREGRTLATFTRSIVERRSDRESWNEYTGGTLHKVGYLENGRHYLIPDAFLPYRNESAPAGVLPTFDTPDPATPRTIATVHSAISYDVTLVGEESLDDCGPVAHLKLRPRHSPDRYNVREMWVRRSDLRLCKAVFASRLFQEQGHGTPYPTIDTVTLDKNGLIASWSSFIQIHLLIATYAVVDTGTFTGVAWKTQEPQALFK